MTDHDALLRAICDCPDDDTPRLIYADFLEEAGDAVRAAFIRAQVELARTPLWEPFSVLVRTRKQEWSEAGEPFRDSLPVIPAGIGVEWHESPFRRGLGWRVVVKDLGGWAYVAPRLMEVAPIGELDLNPAATRDDWRAFARGPWVKNLRVVHLDGTSPVEPIRALCENPDACGITDIWFHRASSPGLPELVEDLLASPLGRGLKGLHFNAGYQSVDVLLRSIGDSLARLERLTFENMGLTPMLLEIFLQLPAVQPLRELRIVNERLDTGGSQGVPGRWYWHLPATLESLVVRGAELQDLGELEETELPRLKILDLGRNPGLTAHFGFNTPSLLQLDFWSTLQVVRFDRFRLGRGGWLALLEASCWNNLVEVDVTGQKPVESVAIRLLSKDLPPRLVAWHMDRPTSGLAEPLQRRLGERILFR